MRTTGIRRLLTRNQECDEIWQRFSRIEVLSANAHMRVAVPPDAVTDQQFAVNLKRIVFTVQNAVPSPLHRFGKVARAALYRASDDASFMTGSKVVLDGRLPQF
jgi:NAD(P)-dependent dehydrogenase (short-subunit alcohol dehydrogenase family)